MNPFKLGLTLAALLPVIVLIAPGAHASLIVNGSFETAAPGYSLPGPAGTDLVPGSAAREGWSIIGTDVAWLESGTYGVSTIYGQYLLDLTGFNDRTPYGGIEQSIATTPGQTYTLSFAVGVNNSTPFFAGPVTVRATAGNVAENVTVNPPGANDVWTTETLSFTAISTSTLIALQGVSGIDYIGLDNISVDPGIVNIDVPEPSSLLLLGSALAGLAGLRKAGAARRRQGRPTA